MKNLFVALLLGLTIFSMSMAQLGEDAFDANEPEDGTLSPMNAPMQSIGWTAPYG